MENARGLSDEVASGGEASALIAVFGRKDYGACMMVMNARAAAWWPEIAKRRIQMDVVANDLTPAAFEAAARKIAERKDTWSQMQVLPLDGLGLWELAFLRSASTPQLHHIFRVLFGEARPHEIVQSGYVMYWLSWVGRPVFLHAARGRAAIVAVRPNERRWLQLEIECRTDILAKIHKTSSSYGHGLYPENASALIACELLQHMNDPIVTWEQVAETKGLAGRAPISCARGGVDYMVRMTRYLMTIYARWLGRDPEWELHDVSVRIYAAIVSKSGGMHPARWEVDCWPVSPTLRDHPGFVAVLDTILQAFMPCCDPVMAYAGARVSELGGQPAFRLIEGSTGAGSAHDDLEAMSGLTEFLRGEGWSDQRIEELFAPRLD